MTLCPRDIEAWLMAKNPEKIRTWNGEELDFDISLNSIYDIVAVSIGDKEYLKLPVEHERCVFFRRDGEFEGIFERLEFVGGLNQVVGELRRNMIACIYDNWVLTTMFNFEK